MAQSTKKTRTNFYITEFFHLNLVKEKKFFQGLDGGFLTRQHQRWCTLEKINKIIYITWSKYLTQNRKSKTKHTHSWEGKLFQFRNRAKITVLFIEEIFSIQLSIRLVFMTCHLIESKIVQIIQHKNYDAIWWIKYSKGLSILVFFIVHIAQTDCYILHCER